MKKYFQFIFRSNINIFKTIYINFRMFPFHIAYKLPIYVYGNWRFVELNGKFIINSPVTRGMILIGINVAGYVVTPKGSLRMKSGSRIIFHEKTYISQGCQIFLNTNSTLILQKYIKLGDSVKLICYKNITIGEMSEVTWESQVTDYGSHYIENLLNKRICNIIKPVYIGKRNWIGNRTTIMPGTRLPDNIIVTTNSLLNKDYISLGINDFSVIGGMPAKLIKENVRRIYSHSNENMLRTFFSENELIFSSENIIDNY